MMCFGLKTRQTKKLSKNDIGRPYNFRVVQHIGYNDKNLSYDVKNNLDRF